ncbi:ImmA/IrrE family metallo-endopeptidase [Sphingomonas adhaesiva]|uniref:ImmA/IrrE family metallo-endopeptidase n=1 Tax=Sphingomonas adhaesiva TaxID=28212 RepID=UPI002FF7B584
MTSPSPAERLLDDLEITEPDEIDVEVIAWAVGARVRYRPLPRGDARIVGMGERAIITVDDRASRVRQRFSVAHELGHWHHHRGQRLICHGGSVDAEADACEREADRYAADLLIPRSMLMPRVADAPISFALVERTARRFGVSTLAAALRLADVHPGKFALIVTEPDGRRWFRRSPALPKGWRVRVDTPDFQSRTHPPSDPDAMQHVLAYYHLLGRGLRGLLVSRETVQLRSGQMLMIINAVS